MFVTNLVTTFECTHGTSFDQNFEFIILICETYVFDRLKI